MDESTPAFGEKMKEQVEERLRFYEEGVAPRKNADVMHEVVTALGGGSAAADPETPSKKQKKDKKKRKAESDTPDTSEKKEKKKKKDKKEKKAKKEKK